MLAYLYGRVGGHGHFEGRGEGLVPGTKQALFGGYWNDEFNVRIIV